MGINIDDLVGKPYKKNGRGPDGYDCYGLAIEVEKRFGHTWLNIEDCTKENYSFDDCLNQWKNEVKVIEIDSPISESDVILIKDRKGIVSHIGVYLGNNQIIHCNYLGVHIDKLTRMNGLIGKVYQWLP
ncbi:MAG: C40 family peptidase [Bacteroidales bacterium]|nr:C40 family peptidase [Candidatus Scybalousia scybalohippi]